MTRADRRGAGSALRSVGLAGGLWGVTHLITHALLTEAPTDTGDTARADSLGALAIAALALLTVSAAVLAVVAGPPSRSRSTRSLRNPSTLVLAATAPAVYVAIEIVVHIGSHHDGAPPIGLVAVGAAAHVGVTLAARQLWAIFLDRTIPAITICTGDHAAPPALACHPGEIVGLVRRTLVDLNPGRAPPA